MMDIEGYEGVVVAAASRLLDEIRPTWVMELHGDGGVAAYQTLVDRGYRVRCAVDVPIEQQVEYQRAHAVFEPST